MTDENKQKLETIVHKLNALGWIYEALHWNDDFIMTHRFRLYDRLNVGCYWEVSIEDHHDELDMPEPLDDWVIYTSYHDPDQKDWYGNDYAASSAIEFETMKLFMEFVEVLESERIDALIIISYDEFIGEDSNVRSNNRGTVD